MALCALRPILRWLIAASPGPLAGLAWLPVAQARPTGPRPGGEGGAPCWTYDLPHPGVVWLPVVRVGWSRGAGFPEWPGSRAGSPGRRGL